MTTKEQTDLIDAQGKKEADAWDRKVAAESEELASEVRSAASMYIENMQKLERRNARVLREVMSLVSMLSGAKPGDLDAFTKKALVNMSKSLGSLFVSPPTSAPTVARSLTSLIKSHDK